MTLLRYLKPVLMVALVAGLATAGYLTRAHWLPLVQPAENAEAPGQADDHGGAAPSDRVLLTEQAQRNLSLTAKPLQAGTFWKTITVPGVVVDRPGHSDRGVVAPVTGVVKAIHHFPGDTVAPGEPLFTIRILSETLHTTQTDLFKATQDITLAQAQKKRLAASAGAIPESRVIEVDNQITRLNVAVKAYRQELLNRGLSDEQIAAAAKGTFVVEIAVKVPPRPKGEKAFGVAATSAAGKPASAEPAFEVQEQKVELGQQVLAGQTLCLLANHQMLAVEGKAFREETPLLERAVREDWSVDVDFQEDKAARWPALDQKFAIRQISNNIDQSTRTFTFLIPFENQSRAVERDGKTIMLWRFRPGHQVRLNLRVEKLENVFVLPPEAVVREGGEAYVFRQNGDVYDRKPVHVVHRDRRHVVVANDGSVLAGVFVAQRGAVQLNRMIKAQSGTMPKGFHIHPDGSVHMGGH